ncbi:NAD-binding protein [Methylomarinum sp. Ch1-1]|uniref:NAD-binding protein n=1 Tax=Methylomarinum roseum TaxID=3067653 RepID=A0AAU7NWJ8_9GAMM|nr:NAD-binding protein [Methylomarinum sp. Ch1-1]MDP4522625.1 NAD-binding protein [Methylomarinum sp. Ch1-1]
MRNIVVFGYNRLSIEALKRLDTERHNVIIVEQSETAIESATEKGYAVATIDFRDDEDLKSIGLGKHIDTIFCFLTEDSENVFLTISARAIDPALHIIAIVEDPDAVDKLIAAGANKVIDPYQICGRKIHELIKKPDITNIIDHTVFGRQDLNIAEVVIPENSVLENIHSSRLRLNEDHNLILIGIIDKDLGEDLHFATGEQDYLLNAGDTLVILGPSRDIRAFKKEVAHVE